MKRVSTRPRANHRSKRSSASSRDVKDGITPVDQRVFGAADDHTCERRPKSAQLLSERIADHRDLVAGGDPITEAR